MVEPGFFVGSGGRYGRFRAFDLLRERLLQGEYALWTVEVVEAQAPIDGFQQLQTDVVMGDDENSDTLIIQCSSR